MHAQQHLDSLGWALRNLETFVTAQLGASGQEGLAKFRQTFDHLHGDLANSAALQAQVVELGRLLSDANERANNAVAAVGQASQTAAATPAAAGDAELVSTAAGRAHQAYQSMLLVLNGFGELPAELKVAVDEATAAIDTLVMIAPSDGNQAPTEDALNPTADPVKEPPVEHPAGGDVVDAGSLVGEGAPSGKDGKVTDSAQVGTENSGPGADQMQQATGDPAGSATATQGNLQGDATDKA